MAAAAAERAALVAAHKDALRVQQAVLDDMASQLERAKSALVEAEQAASEAGAQRDAAER